MFGSSMANPSFYQPYMANSIGASGIGRGALSGLGKGLFSKFSFTGLLNGASKTLNVVNQAIPIYYQVKPMVSNAKTMFRIVGAMKDNDYNTKKQPIVKNSKKSVNNRQIVNTKEVKYTDNNEYQEANPTFFI